MSKKPETTFKEQVIEDLRQLPLAWICKTNEVATRGIPDILMCVNSAFIALELKATSIDEPSALQKWNLEKVAAAGGLAFVVDPSNWDNTLALLHELACQSDKSTKKFSEHQLN